MNCVKKKKTKTNNIKRRINVPFFIINLCLFYSWNGFSKWICRNIIRCHRNDDDSNGKYLNELFSSVHLHTAFSDLCCKN